MRAGQLRHKIIIQTVTETRDSVGGITESWATYATLQARLTSSGGREFWAAQKMNAETQVLFITRYKSGVTSKMRVNHGGTIYDIIFAIDPDGRGRELHISCKTP